MGNILFNEAVVNQNTTRNSIFHGQSDRRASKRLSAKLNSNASSRGIGKHRGKQIFVKNQIIKVDNHYLRIGQLLGSGGFADVYGCQLPNIKLTWETMDQLRKMSSSSMSKYINDDEKSDKNEESGNQTACFSSSSEIIELVAKVERAADFGSEFDNEHRILQDLSKSAVDFMPQIFCMGFFDEHRIIVMQRISMDCETLLKNEFGGRMGPSMASEMICAMLYCLESLHKCGYVHNDIKPENFLLDSEGKIFLIDYGLASKYRDKDNKHIEYAKSKALKGTLRYASINMHNGIMPSRRDDVESLFYVWLYFMLGKLPWQNIHTPYIADRKRATYKRWKNVLKVKQNCTINNVCRDFEPEMVGFIQQFKEHITNLEFEQEPDYQLLYGLLRRIIVTDVTSMLLGSEA